MVKEHAKQCPHYIRNVHNRGDDSLCDKWMCEVKSLPKWILVTERLPENRQRCLVYTTTYRIGYFAKSLEKVDKYDLRGEKHHGWYYHDSGCGYCEILNVTHWMPLPELPQEDE